MVLNKGKTMRYDSKLIICAILCGTFLFTGWTAGSSVAYRRGYDEAQRQQDSTQLNKPTSEIPQTTQAFLSAARNARHELLVRYTGQTEKDFLTLFAAHQKGSGEICKAYIQVGTTDELKEFCKKTIIPQVINNRTYSENYLEEKGL
jgi:hypothetical protein